MNERIRQLANEAGLQPFEDCGPKYVYKMEKFAELIVGECVGIADEYDGVGSTIVSRIKQHFGVDGMSTEDKKILIKELLGVKNERSD